LPDRVTVLAETAELASEIDVARAEAALKRAQDRIASHAPELDWDRVAVALQRALIRIQVARKHRGVPVGAA
jgi:F-type H+-transporting ATPase subunit epsilon